MKNLNDQQLLQFLSAENQRLQNEAFTYLYKKEFKPIRIYVERHYGNAKDAEDVFQDAMVVLYTKIRQDNFVLNASLHTFLQAICRNIWKKKLRDRKPTEDLDKLDNTPYDKSHLEVLEANEKTKLLATYIRRLGIDCQRMFILYYFERIRMKNIAKMMNLASEAVAKNRKSRCMKHFRNMIADNKMIKELLSR